MADPVLGPSLGARRLRGKDVLDEEIVVEGLASPVRAAGNGIRKTEIAFKQGWPRRSHQKSCVINLKLL